MQIRYAAFTAILAVVLAASGFSVAAQAGEPAEANASAYRGSFLCPDLAQTELFRSKGLDYVHTMGYAEALLAVAGGVSRFAPPPVPAEWQTVATNWTIHLVTHETGLEPQWLMGVIWERFSWEENPCDPQLLHKASLEYRSRPGNGNAAVLYPYYSPLAAHELEELLRPMAARVGQVFSKIQAAEQVGAKECSPEKVARAKELLETARRATAEYHYDVNVIDRFFAAAERSAEELMEERRFAAMHGLRCLSTN